MVARALPEGETAYRAMRERDISGGTPAECGGGRAGFTRDGVDPVRRDSVNSGEKGSARRPRDRHKGAHPSVSEKGRQVSWSAGGQNRILGREETNAGLQVVVRRWGRP